MKRTQLLLHRFRTTAVLTSLTALLSHLAAPPAFADTTNIWWDNSGTTSNVWGQTANWATTAAGGTDPTRIPGVNDIAIFNVDGLTTAQTVALNSSRSAAGLRFTNGATSGTAWTIQANLTGTSTYGLSIGSGGITIASGLGSVNFSSGQGNLNNPLTADQTWDVNSAFTHNAVISGAYSLTKSGSAWLTLQAGNTYTGDTVVNGGVLSVAGGNSQLYKNSSTVNSTLTVSNNAVLIVKTFGQNSDASQSLGNLRSSPAGLVLDGGTVRINGDNASRARGLTVGPNGATIEVYNNINVTITGAFATPNDSSTITLGGTAGSSGTIQSVLTNSVSLVKTGACSWTLSGVNTYSGSTTVSEGTMQIGGAGSLGGGAYAGNITNDATLQYSSGAAQTLSGSISGSGALIKDGNGTLALSAANTYSGDTTISAGRLIGVVGGSCANSTVVLNSATATHGVSVTDTSKGWTNAALTVSAAGFLEFDFSAVTPSPSQQAPLVVNGLADFTVTPSVRVLLSSALPAGTYPLMTWGSTNGTLPTTADLIVTPFAGKASQLAVSGNSLNLVVLDNVKDNNTLDLTNSASWTANIVPGSSDTVLWDNTVLGANTTSLGADTAWGGIKILNPGGLVTINPGNTLTNSSIDLSSATQDLTILADYYPASSTAHTIQVAAGRTLTMSNILANIDTTGGISGPGTVRIIGSANAVRQLKDSATLLVDGGDLTPGPAANISALSLVAAAGDTVYAILTNGGSVTIPAGKTGNNLNIGLAGTGTNILAVESGSSINIAPSSTTAANTIGLGRTSGATGILNLNGGSLNLTNKNNDASDSGETKLWVGTVSGAIGIANLNAGTAYLPKIETFSGATGTLNLNGARVVAMKPSTDWIANLTTVNVQTGGAILDSDTNDVVVTQPLLHDAALGATPDGGLTKLGTGTLTLTGANTYTGNTTVSNGTLAIQVASIATNSTVSVAGGAVLQLEFSETNTVAAFVTNGVSLAAGIYSSNNVASFISGGGSLQVQATGPTPPTPESITSTVSGGNLILNWTQSGWKLATGTNVTAVTNIIPGATSPHTNSLTEPQRFYRLVYP